MISIIDYIKFNLSTKAQCCCFSILKGRQRSYKVLCNTTVSPVSPSNNQLLFKYHSNINRVCITFGQFYYCQKLTPDPDCFSIPGAIQARYFYHLFKEIGIKDSCQVVAVEMEKLSKLMDLHIHYYPKLEVVNDDIKRKHAVIQITKMEAETLEEYIEQVKQFLEDLIARSVLLNYFL